MASGNKLIPFIQNAANRIDALLKNKLVVSALMLYQGVNFLLHPHTAMTGMARSVATTVFLAAGTSVVLTLTAKERDRTAWKRLVAPFIWIIFSAALYLRPNAPAKALRTLLALAVLYTGVVNLLQSIRLDRLRGQLASMEQRIRTTLKDISDRLNPKQVESSETAADINVGQIIEDRIQAKLNPIEDVAEKLTAKPKRGQQIIAIILAAATTVFGVLLLVWPFETNKLLMRFTGTALTFTAASDLWMAFRLWRIERNMQNRDDLPL